MLGKESTEQLPTNTTRLCVHTNKSPHDSPRKFFMWSTAIFKIESLSSLRGTALQAGII